jgi:hypothetical protein
LEEVRRRISDDELSYLYHRLGKAVWHLQYVEEALGYLYIIKGVIVEPYSISEEDAKQKLTKIQTGTFGSLLKASEKKNLIKDPLLTDLKNLNNVRRWLIHKSLIESGDDLYTDKGRKPTFDRIQQFIKEAIRLQKQVSSETISYCVSKGISEAWINAKAGHDIRKLRGGP